MGPNVLGDRTHRPTLGLFQFVLRRIEYLLDPPSSQVEQRDESGWKVVHRRQELVAGPCFRIPIPNPPHGHGAINAHKLIGLDPVIDRIRRVPRPAVVHDGLHVGLGARDEPRTHLRHRHTGPEDFVHEGGISDEDRGMLSPARLVLGELPLKSAPKHGQFVYMSTVALDDPKVAHEPCVKAEEVQIVGGDLLPLGIVGGMNGMLDMMAIDREDGDPLSTAGSSAGDRASPPCFAAPTPDSIGRGHGNGAPDEGCRRTKRGRRSRPWCREASGGSHDRWRLVREPGRRRDGGTLDRTWLHRGGRRGCSSPRYGKQGRE